MKNNAYIFDWSGTLSDNFKLFHKVCKLMFIELGGVPLSPDELRLNFTTPFMKFWNKYFPELTKDKQCEMFDKYIHQVGNPEIYEGVYEVIKKLHNDDCKMFVVSGDPESKLLPEIMRSGLGGYFEKVIGGIHEKGEVMNNLIEEYHLDKNLTMCVGDTDGDIEAGKMAGIKTIGITWGIQHGSQLAKSNPDLLIDNLSEII